MSKLLNLGIAAVFALSASLPVAVMAQDDEDSQVTTNWKNIGGELGRGMRNVGSMSAEELAETLTALRSNVVENASLVPDVLAGASEEELAAWTADVKYALGFYDAAIAAAEEGHAEAAAAIMMAFDSLREDMHEKYGV